MAEEMPMPEIQGFILFLLFLIIETYCYLYKYNIISAIIFSLLDEVLFIRAVFDLIMFEFKKISSS